MTIEKLLYIANIIWILAVFAAVVWAGIEIHNTKVAKERIKELKEELEEEKKKSLVSDSKIKDAKEINDKLLSDKISEINLLNKRLEQEKANNEILKNNNETLKQNNETLKKNNDILKGNNETLKKNNEILKEKK